MTAEDVHPIVVVTGGGSGIGEACAELLSRRGWRVVVADVAADRGEEVARRIKGEFLPMDVADVTAVTATAQRIEEDLGPVAALVNSAGIIQRPLPPEELAMEDWDHVVAVDQRGTYVACLAFGHVALANRLLAGDAQALEQCGGVELHVAQHVPQSVAVYDGAELGGAVLFQIDVHGVGVAEQVVHVAEDLLVGADEEDAQVVRLVGEQIV